MKNALQTIGAYVVFVLAPAVAVVVGGILILRNKVRDNKPATPK